MCGINGIIYFKDVPAERLRRNVTKMQVCTQHRGPDQSDIVILPRAALGMNRLSIVAPNEHSTVQSDAGHGLYALYNGEISNYQTLRRTMHARFANHTDTALILPMFQQLGPDFIRQLAGMFAIAVYDEKHGRLQLWRDPLGIKPLYFYKSDECLVFSSEIKAIYAVVKEIPKPEFAALDHALRFRFVPGRSSVFPDIQRVLPGETITVTHDGTVQRKQYWQLRPNAAQEDPKTSIEEFRQLLQTVVAENTQADVKGGYFVSGGLDSSLTTALALQNESRYTKPISIRFTPNSVIDEKYGKLLESFLGTSFNWVEISSQTAREAMVELSAFQDEPLENPIHIGTYLMAKRARELGVKSVITGDGSDEFFLGYERHNCWFTQPLAEAQQTYPRFLWTCTPAEAEELYTADAMRSTIPMKDAYGEPIEPFANIDRMLQFERLDRLTEYHNMRLDRMTMAHGVEAKVPFLDHRIVEYSLRIPAATLHGQTAKEWLKQAASPWLPKEILYREKVHFPSLPDTWLGGEGAEWARTILLDPGAHIRQWTKRRVVERFIDEQEREVAKHGRLLWALIVLELWLQNVDRWRD